MMSELSCAQFGAVADELALGVLAGPERARALAHVERCALCAEQVRQRTAVTDGLLGLIPGREPPIGFEARMTSRLGLAEHRRRPRVWLRAAAVAALIATVFALGGFALGTALHSSTSVIAAQTGLLSEPLTTGAHQVGRIYAATSTPSWVYMTIDTDRGTGPVTCQLQQQDGHLITLGTFDLNNGYGTWGTPSPVDPATVASARVIARDGALLATATFPPHR